MDGYYTIKEMAKKWNCTARWVQQMCNEGRIPGVSKFGRSWAIPSNAERPQDARIKTGKYKEWRKKISNRRKGL